MTRSQMKFHATVLTAIVLGVIVVYALTQPKQQSAEERGQYQNASDRFVQISSASYGRNCNHLIEKANAFRQQYGDASRYSSVPDETIPLNNAIIAVSDLCNGEVYCRINVSADTLGDDPYPSCVKELEVGYRCFSFDRLWRTTALDRETLTIDCRNK